MLKGPSVISSAKFKSVSIIIPQGLILGPILFNISYMISMIGQCAIRKSADDTKLGGQTDRSDGCAVIQENLDRFDKQTNRKLKKLIKGNTKFCTWEGVSSVPSRC